MPVNEPTVQATYIQMQRQLHDVVPELELRYKAELVYEINQLKRLRNALILGHNYMEPALFHTVADYTGDSLELCRKASRTEAERIVFCGVRFMAETAKILNPNKRVLLPSLEAGCSLAESITAQDVKKRRRSFPDAPIVSYINTYADVKAESDYCCTSGNAVAVVDSLAADRVIFVPDEYLARNVARETGKEILFPSTNGTESTFETTESKKGLIGWRGKCEVHEKFSVDDIRNAREQFPDVAILAHPECSPKVVEAADFSGSTSAIARFVDESEKQRYLLLTECSMADNIVAENPSKEMLRFCSIRCPHMNEITLEDTLAALLQDRYTIEVPEDVAGRARGALKRMLAIS